MANPIELTVPASLDGERVDKAIATLLDLSRARASTLIERGVEIDGEQVRASDRVSPGQTLRCPEPEGALRLVPEPVAFNVLHEDPSVLVVDKPAGVVVHPGSGQTRGTLVAGLINRYPDIVGVGTEDRWGLVHRLDKDTSGTIVVARTQPAYETLVSQLRKREITRTYSTLVEGQMTAPTGTIEAPIGRDPQRPTRRAVIPTGKHARTHYEVVETFAESDASLVRVRLETGRTHQIRVHMAAIGHPVAGDRTYGASRRDLGVPRTFLHASAVGLTHPETGESFEVSAPMPKDLSDVLDRLA